MAKRDGIYYERYYKCTLMRVNIYHARSEYGEIQVCYSPVSG